MEPEFNEDPVVKQKLSSFRSSVQKIQGILNTASTKEIYEKLTLKEKIDYDLFMTYTLNTLYWLYLKTRNEDPNQNEIKNQLSRIKEYMMKAKQAHERQTIRPKVDQEAAKRFIKHGINLKSARKDGDPPPNKKIKFSD